MVGVPRSKGCRICVQRRVKVCLLSTADTLTFRVSDCFQCDQTRPVCLRCKKGNRPCPGYDVDMKFQDEGPKLRKHFQEVASKKAAEDGTSELSEPDLSWREASSSSDSSAATIDVDSSDGSALQVQLRERAGIFSMFEDPMGLVSKRSNLIGAPLLDSMEIADFTESNFIDLFGLNPVGPIRSPSMEQQQLLYTFTSSVAPQYQENLFPNVRNHGRWLSYLPPLSGSNSLLDSSIRAATMAHLGRIHHSQEFMQESRRHYGKALRLLSSHLADPEKGMASETLSSTVLLSFYEMFASDSDDSWVRHAGGAGTLMKLRGPNKHRNGFDREIYLAYRHALIIQAFEICTPCFLNQPEWRQLSHDIHEDLRASGVVGGERSEIFEVAEQFFLEMVQLPELVNDARNMSQTLREKSIDRYTMITNLLRRTITHRTTLKSLFVRFRAALKNYGQEPTSRMSNDPVFPVQHEFINVFVAATYTGYWTVLMLLNSVLKELDPGNYAMYRQENAEAARECCQSTTYMAASSFLGPFFVVYALRVSLMNLDNNKQRAWIIRQLQDLGDSRLSMALNMIVPNAHPDNGMPRIRQAVEDIRELVQR